MTGSLRGRLFTAVLCAAVLFLLVACPEPEDPPGKKTSDKKELGVPDILFIDVVHRFLNIDGSLAWELRAKKEKSYDEVDIVFLYDFVYIEYEEGKQKHLCKGAEAKITEARKNREALVLEIIKDAYVRDTATGNTLEGNHLIWNNHTGKLMSEDVVKITKQQGVTIGKGMIADKNLENMRLKKHIRTIYSQ